MGEAHLAPRFFGSTQLTWQRPSPCRLDLNDIRIITKSGGTIDDSEMVDGLVFDQKAAKAAGGPSRMEKAKVGLRHGTHAMPAVHPLGWWLGGTALLACVL